MTTHRLKILPIYLERILEGVKTFEIRFNDRDYQIGDDIIFIPFDEAKPGYMGDNVFAKITYITNFEQKPGFVVFGIRLLEDHQCPAG